MSFDEHTTIDAIYGHVRARGAARAVVEPKPAVACLLWRSGVAGLELYLAKRAPALAFLGGTWAFPGGKLEPGESYGQAMAREAREELGLALPARDDAYLDAGRWITPAFAPIRFDTRFVLCELPAGQQPDWRRSGGELVDGAWHTPGDWLRQWREATLLIPDPVRRALEAVGDGGSDGAARCAAAAVEANRAPRIWELAPGVAISPLRTLTLPPATHTNCYLIGAGEMVAIDPGAADAAEQAALADAITSVAGSGRRLVEVWLTHHHMDHAAGAAALAKRFGVGIAAHAETAARLAGAVEVTRHIAPGEIRVLAGDPVRRVRAEFTPGHAPGHLCFHELETGFIAAGDMVAAVGTILIDPSEGDMSLYLSSLEHLRSLAPRVLLPAHGGAIVDADGHLGGYIRHRLWREERVVDALSALGPATPSELVVRAYDDVPPAIHPLAQRSLVSHLRKLSADGRVGEDAGAWRLL